MVTILGNDGTEYNIEIVKRQVYAYARYFQNYIFCNRYDFEICKLYFANDDANF